MQELSALVQGAGINPWTLHAVCVIVVLWPEVYISRQSLKPRCLVNEPWGLGV